MRALTRLAPPAERRRIAAFGAVVLLLHALGLGLYLAFAAGRPAFAGAGLLAYTLGLRHAFDADHIAAIDNTVRKLRGEDRHAAGVGFFFSLGHATVVFLLACGLALAAGAVGGAIDPIHAVGGYVGATVSGGFLWLIGTVNLLALLSLVATTRRIWRRDGDEAALARATAAATLPARLLAAPLRRIRSAWQMYPLGILFGLGFDTATEIGLLALSATAAGAHAPALAIVSLPLLFAAAMSLVDTADSVVMSSAYGWGLRRPVRRIYFNLVVTAFSVVAALTVGGVELLQVASGALGLEGALWRWLDRLDFQLLGYAIVAAFVLTWALAAAVWRLCAIERRWDERFAPPAASP